MPGLLTRLQLTGDKAGEAERISQQLGIPVLAASATPQKKLEYIKDLQEQGHKVAMVRVSRTRFC